MSGNPALVRRDLNERLTFRSSAGVPIVEVTTKPESI
jgi:hypothetical protein